MPASNARSAVQALNNMEGRSNPASSDGVERAIRLIVSETSL